MGHIKMVFRFGWPYLKRYWLRLVFGVALGMLFGVTNASFVWATKTLMERLETPAVPSTNAQPAVAANMAATNAPAANILVAASTPETPDARAETTDPKEKKTSSEFKNRV